MIIVKLMGGLGNQMFQYAAARSLSEQLVYFDHRYLEKNNSDHADFTARKYELYIFNELKVCRATQEELERFESRAPFSRFRRLLSPRRYYIVRQQGNMFINLPADLSGANCYLDGYFQSERYFRHMRTELLKEFSFPELDPENKKIREQIISAPNSVCIHIRRGDYLKSEKILAVHGVLPFTYYQVALKQLREIYGRLQLFIFSEDQQWVRSNFHGPDVHYVNPAPASSAWQDMSLMTYCKHHIIANSSFSWWGAWLSESRGRVYAPAQWFNPLNVKFRIEDFVPEQWTIIDEV